ncbi:MAG: proB [Candidatus Taylorbacteria bacterium]|nr:proB [Candidatus Taylorbacteria bacterium]
MKRVVVKIGTGNLVSDGSLDASKASDIARQVAELISQGIEVALVSSGAIQAGRERLARIGQNPELAKKEWAGIGARHLLNLWGNSFENHGFDVAQIWLTYTNWVHKKEYESIRTSILSYFKSGIIPLVNENDVVSQREIESMEAGISENDRLARMVAEMIGADAILFLTDIGGVYDKDPRKDISAKRYQTVGRKTLKQIDVSESRSDHGTGGIGPKLEEAFVCFEKGMKVSIAGLEPDVLLRFAAGEDVGTMIV